MVTAKGLIRKISISDPKTGLTYIVGKPMRDGAMTVVEIRLDVEESNFKKISVYDVIICKIGSTNLRIWKTIEGMPVVVEYDVDEAADV